MTNGSLTWKITRNASTPIDAALNPDPVAARIWILPFRVNKPKRGDCNADKAQRAQMPRAIIRRRIITRIIRRERVMHSEARFNLPEFPGQGGSRGRLIAAKPNLWNGIKLRPLFLRGRTRSLAGFFRDSRAESQANLGIAIRICLGSFD